MGDLDQQVAVCLANLVFMALLGWKDFLWVLLVVVCLASLELVLNHINDVFEPLGEEYGVLSTARLSKVGLTETHSGSLFFDILLEPGWLLNLICDARLGKLVCHIIQGVEQFPLVGNSVFFL